MLRNAWDHIPAPARRALMLAFRSEKVRLKVLKMLGIRSDTGFFTLSTGGLGAIDSAMQQIASTGPNGDYYEFGVYRGYTLWHAQRAADNFGVRSMRFFGFDSFDGLPEIQGNDRDAAIFFSGDYSCSMDEVETQLDAHGFDSCRGALIEGFYDRSLTPEVKQLHNMGPAALVMVDCDLYQSTVPALAFISELLQDGTIILFDDWECFGDSEQHGERLLPR